MLLAEATTAAAASAISLNGALAAPFSMTSSKVQLPAWYQVSLVMSTAETHLFKLLVCQDCPGNTHQTSMELLIDGCGPCWAGNWHVHKRAACSISSTHATVLKHSDPAVTYQRATLDMPALAAEQPMDAAALLRGKEPLLKLQLTHCSDGGSILAATMPHILVGELRLVLRLPLSKPQCGKGRHRAHVALVTCWQHCTTQGAPCCLHTGGVSIIVHHVLPCIITAQTMLLQASTTPSRTSIDLKLVLVLTVLLSNALLPACCLQTATPLC
jgi:hypothetical protein